MAKWLVVTANEITLEGTSGAEVNAGVMRYVFMRKEDGSFGVIEVDGRQIYPASAMVYLQGNTLHVQVE